MIPPFYQIVKLKYKESLGTDPDLVMDKSFLVF